MARRIWGDADPIGRQITAGPNGSFTVIGVVGDVRNLDLVALSGAHDVSVDDEVRVADDDHHRARRRSGAAGDAAAQRRPRARSATRGLQHARMEDLIYRSASQPRLNASLGRALRGARRPARRHRHLRRARLPGLAAHAGDRDSHGARGRAAGRPAARVLARHAPRGVRPRRRDRGSHRRRRWIGTLLFETSARDPWTIAAAVAASRWSPSSRATSRHAAPRVSIRSGVAGGVSSISDGR